MAVYKRAYKTYGGVRTRAWSRFLIVARFSSARLFQSKFLVLFTAACLFYPVGCAAYIYLAHNLTFLETMGWGSVSMPHVDGRFFHTFCSVQGSMAFLLTAFVGPGLVSPDLANGAMPLYFSRPFSRAEYIAGKMSLLMGLLSLITWVPGLILFSIQWSLEGWGWAKPNFWLAGAVFTGCFIWITALALIALALSAWVKWRIAAGALVLGVFFAGAGFGAAINGILRTHYGDLTDLTKLINAIWSDLFRIDAGARLSLPEAWTVLGLACAAALCMLAKRVRPFEVVK
jgi:ABC-2 type transport system permease protein